MMSDVVPIYLTASHNAYGIFGGDSAAAVQPREHRAEGSGDPQASWPVHVVITNSTYDGLLYNTQYIKQMLAVLSIHFDSAWVPYTNFHPIYRGKAV